MHRLGLFIVSISYINEYFKKRVMLNNFSNYIQHVQQIKKKINVCAKCLIEYELDCGLIAEKFKLC